MSIAVSLVIRPSRLLRVVLAAYGAANAGAAALLALVQSARFHGAAPLALACAAAALLAWRAALAPGNVRQIDSKRAIYPTFHC